MLGASIGLSIVVAPFHSVVMNIFYVISNIIILYVIDNIL